MKCVLRLTGDRRATPAASGKLLQEDGAVLPRTQYAYWLMTLLFLAIGFSPRHTEARSPDENGDPDSSTVVYAAEYFARYEVLTATDMLRRIPGADAILSAAERTVEDDDEELRGFGASGDQILINGRRVAGKSNEIVSVLGRIQASLVSRVELIRGISPDIEVRSDGLIVNIVLQDGVTTGSVTTWRAGAAYLMDQEIHPVGSISHGGDRDRLTYVIGAALTRPLLSRQIRPHEFYSPDGALVVTQDEIRYEHNRRAELSGNLLYRLGDAQELRFNALVQRLDDVLDEPRNVFDVDASGAKSLRGPSARGENIESDKWEIGGDYQNHLDGGGRVGALFVYSTVEEDDEQIQTASTAGIEHLVSLEQTEAAWREAIVRGSVQWPLAERQSLEVGAEGAVNELDTSFRLFTEIDGQIVEAELFNAESDVREVRWLGFATHNWSLAPKWSLQTALNAEFSEISQTGADISLNRRFSFLKPRVDLSFDWTRSQQLRARVERTISQLDFANFVTSYDFDDDQVRAGNPELVPEEAWEYEIAYSQRLPNDNGVVDFRLFYHDIDNLIDRIAAAPTRSSRGNLDGARRYGGELKLGLRLGWLKLPDVVVNAAYLYQKAEVPDPLTGARRNFTGDAPYEWNLGFRHDLTLPRLSYGMEISQLGPRSTHEVTWYRKFRSYVEMAAFLEARVWRGLTVMAEGQMLRWDRGERDQVRYLINRGDGAIRRTEWMHRRATPTVTVSLRGAF
jgi:outer membrane receptor protein involved in Fe transport